MPDVNIFSNKPMFCQKNYTVNDTLMLSHFNAMHQANPATSSAALCGDPLMGTAYQKHIVHDLIRCGGDKIDLNFMMDMYPATDPTRVSASVWYNRYQCDADFNIYAANTVTGTVAGGAITFNLLRSNHGGTNGGLSMASEGLQLVDKNKMIWYTITNVDTTVGYGHRITIVPNDGAVIASIKKDQQYLILPFRMIGGCACPVITTSLNSVGYVQELHPALVRRDWRLCIEVLKGRPEDLRYAMTFDMQGEPVDSWYVKQEQDMRLGIRMGINMMAFMGSPTTNPTLLSGVDATIDSTYTGFYGMIPTIQYGGGKVYNIRRDQGFDWEYDFEPIMLWQGSRKLAKRFTGLVGMGFLFSNNDRSNKLVARTGLGLQDYDAFRRRDLDGMGMYADMQKLGIMGYTYKGYGVNLKEINAFSDYRYMGSDRWSNTMILMPTEGVTENGRTLPPIEFYNYGTDQWNNDYQEIFVDERYTTKCDFLSGYATQGIAMGMHCPDQWILVNPIDPT